MCGALFGLLYRFFYTGTRGQNRILCLTMRFRYVLVFLLATTNLKNAKIAVYTTNK